METYKVNAYVYIKPLKVKGVVKMFDKGMILITYFTKKGKRKTQLFEPKHLTPWKDVKKENTKIDTNVSDSMDRPLVIKIKYHADIEKIQPISIGNWIDLRVAETVHLKKGESALISLGIGMKLPQGYEAHVVPRSSTFKSFGVIQTNHMGVIDNSYSGNEDVWKFPALAVRDTVIHKNDRICQFRIQKIQPKIKFVKVENLDPISRSGFGKTGKN